jgi:hypothetical protein
MIKKDGFLRIIVFTIVKTMSADKEINGQFNTMPVYKWASITAVYKWAFDWQFDTMPIYKRAFNYCLFTNRHLIFYARL